MTTCTRRRVFSLAAGGLALASTALAAERWIEGRHYFRLDPPPSSGQQAAITEVFSYGCPGCNSFQPFMHRLEGRLPAGSAIEFLPASWIAAENWPVFQRAYLTAKSLGVDRKAHDAMFDAVWKTGELAILDPRTKRLKSRLPSIEDVARFYARVAAVPEAKFLATARSFAVDSAMRAADARIKSIRAESTPTLVVAGQFRVDLRSAGGADQMVEIALSLAQRQQRSA